MRVIKTHHFYPCLLPTSSGCNVKLDQSARVKIMSHDPQAFFCPHLAANFLVVWSGHHSNVRFSSQVSDFIRAVQKLKKIRKIFKWKKGPPRAPFSFVNYFSHKQLKLTSFIYDDIQQLSEQLIVEYFPLCRSALLSICFIYIYI